MDKGLQTTQEVFGLLLVLLLAPVPARADSNIFQDVIDVRVLNLEVVVTDSSRDRVRGLTVDDFTITVDGVQVPIEYFDEIRDGELTTVGKTAPGNATPDTASRTSFLVFLDEVFPLGRDRNVALDHVVDNLAALGADQMAVVAFNGKKIDMLSDLTSSVADLRQVFEGARKRPANGLDMMVLQSAGNGIPRRARFRKYRERIERVTLAAAATMRSFATAPGRKVMILLSGGWPLYYPDETAVSPTLAALPPALGYQDLYRPVSDTANLLGYTLYTVDMKIFHGFSSRVSAEYRSTTEGWAAGERAYAHDAEEDATLLRLAQETGGLAFLDTRSRDALAVTLEDTRTYYSLGFTPQWKGEDRRHRVQVHVHRPDLRVRTRRSFSDLSYQTEVTMMVESALLFDHASTPGSLKARLGGSAGGEQGFRKTLLPLEIEIPLDGLTFLPVRDGWQTQLELRVAVEDGRGQRNEISVVPVVLTYPKPPPPNRHAVYEVDLRLRKRKHDLVVSLFDPVSGQLFWNRLKVAP